MVLKCILSVIGLALFTGQLSYKFYLFANLPVYPAEHSEFTHSITIKGIPGAPSYCCTYCLLLDKRYDLQPAFTLPALTYHLHYFPGKSIIILDIPRGNTTSAALFTPFLRGPPFIRV